MHVVLQPSPSVAHKLRVILPDKRAVDFGKRNEQHYIDHGNPKLMRAHLIRKGAIIPKELRIETDPLEIHRGMLKIKKSSKEDWDNYLEEEYWEFIDSLDYEFNEYAVDNETVEPISDEDFDVDFNLEFRC